MGGGGAGGGIGSMIGSVVGSMFGFAKGGKVSKKHHYAMVIRWQSWVGG